MHTNKTLILASALAATVSAAAALALDQALCAATARATRTKAAKSDDGLDRFGYGPEGFTPEGIDRWGLDCEGRDAEGYLNGFGDDGYDREGFDRDGYNAQELDRASLARDDYAELVTNARLQCVMLRALTDDPAVDVPTRARVEAERVLDALACHWTGTGEAQPFDDRTIRQHEIRGWIAERTATALIEAFLPCPGTEPASRPVQADRAVSALEVLLSDVEATVVRGHEGNALPQQEAN